MEEGRAALRLLAEHTMAPFSKAAADLAKAVASKEAVVGAATMEAAAARATMEGVTPCVCILVT